MAARYGDGDEPEECNECNEHGSIVSGIVPAGCVPVEAIEFRR
ncbi:unnamed protein product [Mycetohabitans rhizoxinica HKI 454]|uniref:Uncharacterized protein n=1 Tax=Mycetohabitans rhizoxinica (strain DSM 19002 / CIP 109453 / HKI 454) TaxID=882378 RepID=E5AQR8_MYCRK|nr:unnamed protein product [Mycetohabitans rhizoxinica HKI 454]